MHDILNITNAFISYCCDKKTQLSGFTVKWFLRNDGVLIKTSDNRLIVGSNLSKDMPKYVYNMLRKYTGEIKKINWNGITCADVYRIIIYTDSGEKDIMSARAIIEYTNHKDYPDIKVLRKATLEEFLQVL